MGMRKIKACLRKTAKVKASILNARCVGDNPAKSGAVVLAARSAVRTLVVSSDCERLLWSSDKAKARILNLSAALHGCRPEQMALTVHIDRVSKVPQEAPVGVLYSVAVASAPMREVATSGGLMSGTGGSGRTPLQEVGSERWSIEAIIMGDVSRDAAGSCVAKNQVHASGQARCADENFHAVHWEEEIFEGAHDAAITFPAYALPGGTHKGQFASCAIPERVFSAECAKVSHAERVAAVFLLFLKQYPDVFVVLQSVGARGPSPELYGMRITGASRIRITSKTHECVQAAILNGLDALWDRPQDKILAVEAWSGTLATEMDRGIVFHSLSPIRAVVNKMQRLLYEVLQVTVQARKVGSEAHMAMRSENRAVSFEWLGNMTDGVFIVRLQQAQIVDHAVCVYATHCIILNNEESFTVKLNANSLNLCGGDAAKRLRVIEVRQLVIVDLHK